MGSRPWTYGEYSCPEAFKGEYFEPDWESGNRIGACDVRESGVVGQGSVTSASGPGEEGVVGWGVWMLKDLSESPVKSALCVALSHRSGLWKCRKILQSRKSSKSSIMVHKDHYRDARG